MIVVVVVVVALDVIVVIVVMAVIVAIGHRGEVARVLRQAQRGRGRSRWGRGGATQSMAIVAGHTCGGGC